MKNNIEVSVITITYNQELYVRETLESICKQNTNFKFEVIVADDCSTDKTPMIIKEYADKYPDIIKPIFRKINLGAWKNFRDALKKLKGKYIALCEGDDYWNDPKKLQLQVDFLEKHPDCSLCFHPVKVFFQNGEETESIFPIGADKMKFNLEELLKNNFIQTNSVMYRNQRSYDNLANDVMPGDWYLHLYHAQFGKIGFIHKTMSTYRRHGGGIWWEMIKNPDKIWVKYGILHLSLLEELLVMFGETKTYRVIIEEHVRSLVDNLINIDKKSHSELVLKSIFSYPKMIEIFIIRQQKQLMDKLSDISLKNDEVNKLLKDINEKNTEINNIKSSKLWKLLVKVRYIKHGFRLWV